MNNGPQNNVESFTINIWGLKFQSTNPGKKTIILLVIILIFILVIAALLKWYLLPFIATVKGKSVMTVVLKKFAYLANLIKRKLL